MNVRALLLAGVVAMVGLGGFLLLQTASVGKDGVRVGKVPVAAAACNEADCLPEIDARTVDGKRVTDEDLAGKTVLINYWATWCGPCVEEMPVLEQFWRQNRDSGVVVLGIAVDGTDESISRFLAKHDVTYPVIRSTVKLDRAFGRPAYLPTTFLFGPDGHLRKQWTRALHAEDLGTVFSN